MTRIDLLVVVGARPNFMKADAVIRAAQACGLHFKLIHTGQHYDSTMSTVFFEELGLPEPDVYLGVGSGSHAQQTAAVMSAFEPELVRVDPRVVVVLGDVNSTLAAALVAAKEHYSVAHVEAGLRSQDPRMPEEINRRLTDHLSRFLYAPSADAVDNLRDEGIEQERIVLVGNTMIDTLERLRAMAETRNVSSLFGLSGEDYAVATLHRPENVDDRPSLGRLVSALCEISQLLPVVFPVHPRTRTRLAQLRLDSLASDHSRLVITDPLGYLDFVGLLASARLVLTDSGGLQEETTALGVPCLTFRKSTERPVTVSEGTNTVVGTDPQNLLRHASRVLAAERPAPRRPALWDGRAGERIVEHLTEALGRG